MHLHEFAKYCHQAQGTKIACNADLQRLRSRLVELLNCSFSIFKQRYAYFHTYFHTLFHSHIFQKNTNNTT